MPAPSALTLTTPYSGADFTSNRTSFDFGGAKDATGVGNIVVTTTSGTVDIVEYYDGNPNWYAAISDMDLGANTITFTPYSTDSVPVAGPTTTITITVVEDPSAEVTVASPTALTTDVSFESVFIGWDANSEADLVGYNVYASTSPAGGLDGYIRVNSSLITDPFTTVDVVVDTTTTIAVVGAVRTTTTEDTIETVEKFKYEISEFNGAALVSGQPLYIVVTAVVYDALNFLETESNYTTELAVTPFAVSSLNVSIPTRKREAVVEGLVTEITTADELIDVKPGTTTNDVHIHPPSTEFEKAYFIADFMIRAQSYSTLLALDDADGDGVSDPVETSPYKQALKVAMGASTDLEVQQLIDDIFTSKALDDGVVRESAQPASCPYLFYRTTLPVRDVDVLAGTIVSTEGDPVRGEAAQQYATTSRIFVAQANVPSYYNATTQRYEFLTYIQAVTAGVEGNQDAGTIVVVNSNPSVSLQGINLEKARNGTDRETNTRLAERAVAAARGADYSTKNGYLKTALANPSVINAVVVGACDCFMQRDWNGFLHKHLKGVVDIYIKGLIPRDCTESVSHSYYSQTNNTVSVEDDTNFIFQVDKLGGLLDISSDYPLFEVSSVQNITRGGFYDVDLLTFLSSGDQFQLDASNSTNSTLGLASTDVVQATFRWKDGSKASLECQPVRSIATVTGELSGVLVEGTTYFFDKSEDPLQLGNSVLASDGIKIVPGCGTVDYQDTPTLNGGDYEELENWPVCLDSIVVTDVGASTEYELDEDYFISSYQRVLFTGEDQNASYVTPQPLIHPGVIESSIVVTAPGVLTLGVDYTVSTTDGITSILALASGALSSGQAYTVEYRVSTPVRFTAIAIATGEDYNSAIEDGDTVEVNYRLEIPTGAYVYTSGESHAMVGTSSISLDRRGVVESSIVVTQGATTYDLGVDYLVSIGSDDTDTNIQRISSGSILDGASVDVAYRSSEQFEVVYSYNSLLQVVQDTVDANRPAGSDVLVKGIQLNGIDLSLTVVPLVGVSTQVLDSRVRSALSEFFNTLPLGTGVRQADIIRVVGCVDGVDYVVVPLLKMTRSEGSLVVRETLVSPEWSLFGTDVSSAFTSQEGSLTFYTQDAGGSQYLPRGVFEDDNPMCVVEDIGEVSYGFNRAYIGGSSITVSPNSGDPDLHTYKVMYQVGSSEDGTTADIKPSPLESLQLGTLEIVFADPQTAGCP